MGWIEFCKKPDEGVLQLLKEFYTNLEESVNDKVFVRVINMSNEAMSKLIRALDHKEGEYSVVMDEGVETIELVKKLCQAHKEVIWVISKNNQSLSFNVKELLSSWTLLFKFIYSRLISTTHTSHITLDRAILLYAMIGKRKVDVRWIIYNIIDSVRSSKRYGFRLSSLSCASNLVWELRKMKKKSKSG